MNAVRTFDSTELVLDATAAKTVLNAIFTEQASLIDSLDMNDDTRGLAQSLLVHIIEQCAAMGTLDRLIRDKASNEAAFSAPRALLAANGDDAWFVRTTTAALANARIYENVRAAAETRFARVLKLHAAGFRTPVDGPMGFISPVTMTDCEIAWI